MNHLDSYVLSLGHEQNNPLSLNEAGMFFVGLKKFAATLAPDTTGALEGQFALPVEEVAQTIASLLSHKIKSQTAYLYYKEMLRGLDREGLAEYFGELAAGDAEDVGYFAQRLGVLVPGGVPIPVAPMPEPLTDTAEIVKLMIATEQQGIVLLRTLRQQLGENPMRFTIEEMLGDEQQHVDRLWQFVPPMTGEQKLAVSAGWVQQQIRGAKNLSTRQIHDAINRHGIAQSTGMGAAYAARKAPAAGGLAGAYSKVDAAGKSVAAQKRQVAMEALAARPGSGLSKAAQKVAAALRKRAAEVPVPQAGDVVVPAEETGMQYAAREQALNDEAARMESDVLRQQNAELAQHATGLQMQVENAGAENASLQQQLEQQQLQAAQGMEMATAATSQAAQEADAKMRLSMRINQMRQALADMVSQDPVAEEGVGFGNAAGPGAPPPPATVNQQAQAQAAQEQAMMAAPADPKAQKEQEQANRAADEAQQQQVQAATAATKQASLKKLVQQASGRVGGKARELARKAGEEAAVGATSKGGPAMDELATKIIDRGASRLQQVADHNRKKLLGAAGAYGAVRAGVAVERRRRENEQHKQLLQAINNQRQS